MGKTLTDRLELLENNMSRLVVGLNQNFQETSSRLDLMEEVADAIVEFVGKENVEAIMKNNRMRKAQEKSDKEKAELEAGLASGWAVKVDTVQDGCTVVGKETDKDGVVLGTGRFQMVLDSVAPVFKEKLMGQAIGYVLEIPQTGGKFEITELYMVNEAKRQETAQVESDSTASEPALNAASNG